MFLLSSKNVRPPAESGTGSSNHSKKGNVMFRLNLVFVLLAAFALVGCGKDSLKDPPKEIKANRMIKEKTREAFDKVKQQQKEKKPEDKQ